MPDSLFQAMNILDQENIHYTLSRTRSDTIQINITFVGARIELEVFQDGHFEMSRFDGNEDVESGSVEMLKRLVQELG